MALVTSLAVGTGTPERADAIRTIYETRPTAGPLGPISVIGDSVMLGNLFYGPDLPDRLVEQGWGPVRARAGVGYSTGYFFNPGQNRIYEASYWIEQWRLEGWDPDAVVVNFGANDVGLCGFKNEPFDECAENAIRHLVDAIGSGKRIWWPKITHGGTPYSAAFMAGWNGALDRVAADHPDFFTWEWPTVMRDLGLSSYDNIHLSPSGYRVRSQLMAHDITASLARGGPVGGAATMPTPYGTPTELIPIEPPVRAFDSREDAPGRLPAGGTVEIDVSELVPPDATAIAAYITASQPASNGYLAAHPCLDEPNTTSFVNYVTGNRGAVTITPLSADQTFCVETRSATDVVVDLQAAFVPDGLRFDPLAVPDRLVDTGQTGRMRHVELEVPDGAEAVSINITVRKAGASGRVTAHACRPEVPFVASLNHRVGETIASAAFVPVSDDGRICLDATRDIDLIVDLTGVFSDGGRLAFQPAAPTRMIETRDGTGGWAPIHGQGQIFRAVVAPPEAEAVSGTITLARPYRNSHLRVWECGPLPSTSNVNAPEGQNMANSLTTGTDAGEVCLFARSTGRTVFDTTGWWIP